MTMDAKISEAIAAVMAGVPMLNKGEQNKHGNYSFASIDDFLEAVRPQMAKAKLVISSDEESFDVINDGKDAWLKMVFAFTAHADGAEYGPLRRTAMVRASMGSQALGAAQSYAEKQFLRSLFKIATGEGASIDSDSHPQSNLPAQHRAPGSNGEAKPAPKERIRYDGMPHETPTALKAAIRTFMMEVNRAPDPDSLDALITSEKALIDQIRQVRPDWWEGSVDIEKGIAQQLAERQTAVMAEAMEGGYVPGILDAG
jgi:hypothetical protein